MATVLSDEVDAYLFLERVRWRGHTPPCPHCGARHRSYFLTPADGRSRATRTGTRSVRRVWKCGACRRQFSVLTGTILQGTRTSVLTWIEVIAAVTGPDAVDSAVAVADRFSISRNTARHMLTRLHVAWSAVQIG